MRGHQGPEAGEVAGVELRQQRDVLFVPRLSATSPGADRWVRSVAMRAAAVA